MLSEAILHKDFSLLFSCDYVNYFRDKFLEELKNVSEVHFASRVHYEYYRRFIVPRLSFEMRRVDRNYVRTSRLEFYISQNYIFIHVEEVNVEKSSRYAYFFLIGFDDNKLFVNELELPLRPMKFRWGAQRFVAEGVEVYEVEDEEMLKMLKIRGSSHGYAVIEEEGRYRVQGEVVVSVVDVEESFDEMLRRMTAREVEEYIIMWVHERIALVLTDIGFNVELTPTRALFLREAARGLGIRDKVAAARRLAKLLAEELVRGRLLGDVGVVDYKIEQASSERYDFTVKLKMMTAKDGDVIIAINLLKDSVTVQAGASDLLGKLYEELMNELIEQIRASKRDFEFHIGNHKVILKNCLSPSIVLRPSSLRMLNLLSTSEIRIQVPGYIFDRDSEILLQHREHGTSVVKFAKPAIARIDVIEVSPDYLSNVNNIVFSMLAKS